MTSALTFVAILFSAVMVHELAHYGAARSRGVPVRAFSIGFGPVLARRRWRGTEWRLSALPLGGYVDLPGMAPESSDDGRLVHPNEGVALLSFWGKGWVLIAGVLANFLFGTVLLTVAVQLAPEYRALTTGTPPAVEGTIVAAVSDGSVAAGLGIEPGDAIVRIGATNDPTPGDAVQAIRGTQGTLVVELVRNGRTIEVVTSWPPPSVSPGDVPLLGVQLMPASVESVSVVTAFLESASFAVRAVPDMVTGFVRGFVAAATGGTNDDVAGPVGMVTMVSQAAQVGIAPVLLLAAIINFSLAVFNLLPIPGLDGGRILMAGIVTLRGRPFEPGQEEKVHFFGIVTVMALIVLITVQELRTVLSGG